jgi:hypothetical protein
MPTTSKPDQPAPYNTTQRSPASSEPGPLPPPPYIRSALRLYIVFLVALAIFEWGSAWRAQTVSHANYPFNTPLFDPAERYSDWTNFTPRLSHYGEPGLMTREELGLSYPYPLPSMYLYVIFIRLFTDNTHAYILFTEAAFLIATLALSLYLSIRLRAGLLVQLAVWATFICGYPAIFLLDRGNIEVFLWLFVLFGLIAYLRRWQYVAAIFFAIAASMKIYPAIFLLLFLPRRQFKALAVGVAATAGFTLASLAAVGPTIAEAWSNMSEAANDLRDLQIATVADHGFRFDHSVFALYKQIGFAILLNTGKASYRNPPIFLQSMAVYSVVAPLAFLALYVLRIRTMPLLNQFMALTLCSVLLPYVSYEYTLVHVYLVFAAFLIFLLQDEAKQSLPAFNPSRTRSAMICFALIFAPMALIAREQYQGQVKCVILLMLLNLILRVPMPSTLFGDRKLLEDSAG